MERGRILKYLYIKNLLFGLRISEATDNVLVEISGRIQFLKIIRIKNASAVSFGFQLTKHK